MKRFVLFLLLLLPGAAFAQTRDTVVIRQEVPVYGFKDGAAATLFSFFLPGAGQMYAGKGGKGFLILAISASSTAIGRNQTEKRKPDGIYYAIGITSWLTGVLQARSDVDEFNARRRRSLSVGAVPVPHGLGFGVSLAR